MTTYSRVPTVRPITPDDLDAYESFAHAAHLSMVSMPRNRHLLLRNIHESLASFSKKTITTPGHERYLFILEDPESGAPIGISSLHARPHHEPPLYAFYHDTIDNESMALQHRETLHVLKPRTTPQGHSRLESLFILPEWRRSGLGRMLSLARMLFLATFPERFDLIIKAELRGVFDESGYCPFWEAIGRPFFHMDFAKADKMRALSEQFIADLIPKHLIYVNLLPKESQAVIGKVYKDTEPALHFLQHEGFTYNRFVDVFDAGPHVSCKASEIRTVKNSAIASVENIEDTLATKEQYLVATQTAAHFRTCLSALAFTPSGAVTLPLATARALGVDKHAIIRYVAMNIPSSHGPHNAHKDDSQRDFFSSLRRRGESPPSLH